jgi:wyosine [tRNA(Phe)-imidazoG37] synthetase (radical SAM superfamily)
VVHRYDVSPRQPLARGQPAAFSEVTSPLTILDHSRLDGRMVYPVRARRSRGISIGVNLFPHKKVCDLDCVYCEVDNPGTSGVAPTIPMLRAELEALFVAIKSGKAFAGERINDIAFSGDGEPTISPLFPEAIDAAIEVRAKFGPPDLKLVLITDALTFQRRATREAIDRMMAHGGEIWAKLDAGTEEYFRLVCRGNVPLTRQLANILDMAKAHPLVIQTMLLRVHGEPTPAAEVGAYIARIRELIQGGAQLLRLDMYTIARPTTEPYATALTDAEIDAITARVRAAVPEVPVETYYSGK